MTKFAKCQSETYFRMAHNANLRHVSERRSKRIRNHTYELLIDTMILNANQVRNKGGTEAFSTTQLGATLT